MLIWRIDSNILPTKHNIAQRVGEVDTRCPLCHSEVETIFHLFCMCLVSRATWFGTCWGIHLDVLVVSDYVDLAKLVIDPLVLKLTQISEMTLKEQTSIQIAQTIECIWNLKNQATHSVKYVNISYCINALEIRTMEHIQA